MTLSSKFTVRYRGSVVIQLLIQTVHEVSTTTR